MYKRKKNFSSIIFIIGIISIFAAILYYILHTDADIFDTNKKIELVIQTLGMFFTTLALFLTYNSLRSEQKQKHISVRPYLILEDIDFAVEHPKDKNKQLDFDFTVANKGVGIANRVKITIKKRNNNEIIFDKEYVRLDVTNNEIAYLLSNIRDDINTIKNTLNKDNNNGSLSLGHYFGNELKDEVYIENYSDVDDYRTLIVEIYYFDIYGKKYKGTFNVELDNEDYDLKSIEEKLEEWD